MRRAPIPNAAEEFKDAKLGDLRLDKRLVSIVARAAASPTASFPKMAPTHAEREALYRFVENDRVAWSDILEPHHNATAARCHEAKFVRVAHDTTWFSFEGEREGLGPVGGNQRGFAGHCSLAVSADDRRAPLGLLALSTHIRAELQAGRTKAQRAAAHNARRLQNREEKSSIRWRDGVRASEQRVGPRASCIHVMDQEADDFAIFADLVDEKFRFVIRGDVARRLDVQGRKHVNDSLNEVTAQVFRTVPLGVRTKSSGSRSARQERNASLMIRGTTIVLDRPSYSQHATKKLRLNVVHVFEPSPPAGAEAVEWALYTRESIGSVAELTAVVDHYRARWRAEEYFKALKTGCAFEKRQLMTYEALLRALALLAPIAWHLLAIRTMARDAGDHPASDIVDEVQLQVLRVLAPSSKLPPKPTSRDVMRAIADLGGHIRQNGEPGWLVLGRGYEDFVKAEMIWRAARAHAK